MTDSVYLTPMQGNVYLSYAELVKNCVYEKGMINSSFDFRIGTKIDLTINNHTNEFFEGQTYWIKLPVYEADNNKGKLFNYRVLKIVIDKNGQGWCKGIIVEELDEFRITIEIGE